MTRWQEGAIVNVSSYKRPDATFIVAEPLPDDPEEIQEALIEYRVDGYLACTRNNWIVIGWERINKYNAD